MQLEVGAPAAGAVQSGNREVHIPHQRPGPAGVHPHRRRAGVGGGSTQDCCHVGPAALRLQGEALCWEQDAGPILQQGSRPGRGVGQRSAKHPSAQIDHDGTTRAEQARQAGRQGLGGKMQQAARQSRQGTV